jgi:hypothetical protein
VNSSHSRCRCLEVKTDGCCVMNALAVLDMVTGVTQ